MPAPARLPILLIFLVAATAPAAAQAPRPQAATAAAAGWSVEALGGLFVEDLAIESAAGPTVGLRAGRTLGRVDVRVEAAWAATRPRFEFVDPGPRVEIDRTWGLFTAGAELVPVAGRTRLGIGGAVGAGVRRDADAGEFGEGRTDWTSLLAVGLALRHGVAPRWALVGEARGLMEDALSTIVDASSGSGNVHWTLRAGLQWRQAGGAGRPARRR